MADFSSGLFPVNQYVLEMKCYFPSGIKLQLAATVQYRPTEGALTARTINAPL